MSDPVSKSASTTAACACGALRVSLAGPPRFTHACACVDCQRRTGSALSYSSFYDATAAHIKGAFKRFRRSSDAGRWHESNFCPDCGVTVFIRLEAVPELICIPVGTLADANHHAPGRLYWSSRRHAWLELPPGVAPVETQ